MSKSDVKQQNSQDAKRIAERLAALPAEKKAQFRALLASKNIDSWQLPIVPLPQEEGDRKAVLSSAQQRLWFIDQYEENSALYNLSGRLQLTGRFHLDAMKQAFATLLERHAVLRSTYQVDELGEAWQRQEQDYVLPMQVEQNVIDMEQACARLIRQPFKLDQDLPVRITLLSEGGEDSCVWQLLFVIHHIAFDAWSEALLIQELTTLYDQFVKDQTAFDTEKLKQGKQLSVAILQYVDYAAWQREWLSSEHASSQRAYWRSVLQDAPKNTVLPFDFPYPDVAARSYEGAEESLTLSQDTVQRAKAFANREGTTLYNVMQAAFVLLLNQQGGGRDLCLGTSVANRQRPELENLLGFLVNTLVLRYQLADKMAFRQLLSNVSSTTRSAFEHQDFPFDLLLDELNIERGQAWSPLFQVLFVYRNVPRQSLQLTDLTVEVVNKKLTQARFDMTVRLNETEQDDGLRVDLEYSTELFRRETIVALLTQYQDLLIKVLEAPDHVWQLTEMPLRELPLREQEQQESNQGTTRAGEDPQQDNLTSYSDEVMALAQSIATGYQELLRKDVELEDSFFQQGGDSILCLQLVARLKKAGIKLTPKLVFAKQTPLSIAQDIIDKKAPDTATAAATESTQAVVADRQTVPLAPIQHWFFEQKLTQADHWNQSVLLSYEGEMDSTCFAQAVKQVFALHPQLNTRFQHKTSDQVVQTLTTGEWEIATHAIAYADLPALLAQQQSLFSLANKAPIRVDLIDVTDQSGGRILLSAHHLVVDGVSWRVLIGQLCQAYFSLLAGQPSELLAPSASYGQWVAELADWPEAKKQAAKTYWQALADTDKSEQQAWVSLPVDPSSADLCQTANLDQPNTLADSDSLEVHLPHELTQTLTTRALTAYSLRIDDLLLAALNHTLSNWRGHSDILVELEGHGRQHDALDLSQTVGWFTSRYPVLLRCHSLEQTEDSLRCLILDTQAQLRRVPDQGQGYGVMRYLFDAFPSLVIPSIVFNYLGQLDRGLSLQDANGTRLSLADESVPNQRHGDNRRKQWLDINGMIKNGKLVLRWQFNRKVHSSRTIQTLADQFIDVLSILIRHCEKAEKPVSLADYPLIAQSIASQQALERVLDTLPVSQDELVNLYPLAPTQQGMLYHTLAEPEKGLYLNQSLIDFHGTLDEKALQQAWQTLMDRHDVLRTGFVWQGLDLPLQYVSKQITLDWQTLTLPHNALHEESIQTLAEMERQTGFDVQKPGLMRFKLIRIRPDYHCLIWTRHHLIVDGWCTGQMVREVRIAYQALVQGKTEPNTMPPLAVGEFSDFVAWLEQQDQVANLSYWQGIFANVDKAEKGRLPKPIKSASGQVSATGGIRQFTQTLNPLASDALKRLSAEYSLTLNALCQAAWALIVSRYTNSDQVVMGITSSGRPDTLDHAENIMGVMITTFPLVANLGDRQQSLLALAQTLQTQLAESREHEHVPLVEIQKAVGDSESLFDNLLVFENYPGEQHEMGGDLHFRLKETRETNNYPLTLVLVPHTKLKNSHLDIRLAVDTQQMDLSVACDMQRAFVTLLERIAQNYHPENNLSCAHLIRHLASAQALDQDSKSPWHWNQTQKDYTVPATLDAYLAQQAEKTPDNTALVCPAATVEPYWQTDGDLQLSYRALHERVSQLAAYLQNTHDVQKGERIALCLHRSPEMVIAMLACVKLACAYVPLDPDMPAKRLTMILNNAQPCLILAQQHTRTSLPEKNHSTVVCMEEVMVASQSMSAKEAEGQLTALNAPPQADDILYVLYTSGSTGQPKGVAVPHAGIVNRIAWMQEAFGLQVEDAVLQKTPYGFDVSVWEFFWPLVTGARLVMAEPNVHKDNHRLVALVREYGITTMHFVPAMLHGFLEQPLAESGLTRPESKPLALKRLICSGEALPYHVQQTCFEKLPNVALHNLYGPTEASIDVTWWDCQAQNIENEVPIGYPIANMQTWILDKDLNPVPVGVEGELYLAGVGLAAGYLGQEEQTQTAFIPNPWAPANARTDAQYARLYRTRDLARYRPDGAIEYLGRADFQVKLRGLRIELGEIEAVIAQYPPVKEVIVQLRQHGQQQALVGYIVADAAIEMDTLSDFMKHWLPAYMVPEHVETLAALPLTPNGKVDRKALPEPIWDQVPFETPATPTEEALAELWQVLLGVEEVGRRDNFFALGGHSLLVTRLVNRINQHFNLNLRLAELMALLDLQALAVYIDMCRQSITSETNTIDSEEERESFEL